jgi:hypothetical protein
MGIHDNINELFTDEKFTILNMSWNKFKEQSGIDIWDLWPDLQVIIKDFVFLFNICFSIRIIPKNEHYVMLIFILYYILIIFHH